MNYHILRNTPRTLELRVYVSGNLTDMDANPTLVITDGNGATVSSGSVTHPGVGIYQSVLSGQANLKVLLAAWTGNLSGQATTLYQNYEIVGNLLFSEFEARNAKVVGGQAALTNETTYPDTLLAGWRSVIADLFEKRLRRPVIQRYARVEFSGWGGTLPLDMSYGHARLASGVALHRPGRLWDISKILTATVNGTAQTVADLEISGYKLFHTTGSWTPGTSSNPVNTVVEYEYGPDPVWPEAHQRALDLLLANAAPKGFPSSATSVSTEDGTFRITNFPVSVEEFLKEHEHRRGFGIA